MKLIYNKNTGETYNWPRNDDNPVQGLDSHLIELTIIRDELPQYDALTHSIEEVHNVNIDDKTFKISWNVASIPIGERSFDVITPRQIRLALLQNNIDLAAIDAAVSNNQVAKVEWEYASYVNRNHPLVEQLGQQLGLSAAQIDALFEMAKTL